VTSSEKCSHEKALRNQQWKGEELEESSKPKRERRELKAEKAYIKQRLSMLSGREKAEKREMEAIKLIYESLACSEERRKSITS